MTAGQLKIKGTQLCYRDNSDIERLLTGAAVAGTFDGNLKVKGTYLHYMDNNGAQKRLLGTLTGNTGTAGRLKVKGQCIRYIDNNGYEREVCESYTYIYATDVSRHLYNDQSESADNQINMAAAWAASQATGINADLMVGSIVQTGPSSATLSRPVLFFDTSVLGESFNIHSAYLRTYDDWNWSTAVFDVVIQNGMPTYPHDPVVVADYDKDNYSGNGGSAPAPIGNGGGKYLWIPLNTDGISWIDKTGTTKLMLRINRDINNTLLVDQNYRWDFLEPGATPDSSKPALVIVEAV